MLLPNLLVVVVVSGVSDVKVCQTHCHCHICCKL